MLSVKVQHFCHFYNLRLQKLISKFLHGLIDCRFDIEKWGYQCCCRSVACRSFWACMNLNFFLPVSIFAPFCYSHHTFQG
uniref:Putative sodium/metabolite cotransporter BASS4ic n=1 Tax=Rhizophora mucronata TaxID=61149 RepID=A0A2P2KWR5_RHIMU